jgi:putative endonuclease
LPPRLTFVILSVAKDLSAVFIVFASLKTHQWDCNTTKSLPLKLAYSTPCYLFISNDTGLGASSDPERRELTRVPRLKTYHVYIMASASRVLYIGVTNNLRRRAQEHQQQRIPGFSARYTTKELVYLEPWGDIRAAIAREKQIKGWLRSKKIALINSFNPHWKDLTDTLR